MKNTELRIGNYVSQNDTPKIITSAIELENIGGLEPMLLTREIIEKAGFENISDNLYIKKGSWFSIIHNGSVTIMTYQGQLVPIAFKSVHELQNLYFAHTGNELELAL